MKTVEELKSNPNFFSCIELDQAEIACYLIKEGLALEYFIFWNGVLIFQGDFHPTERLPYPRSIEKLEIFVRILKIIAVMPEDKEKEFFANYTEMQKDWAASEKCEFLKILLSEMDERENTRYEQTKTYLEMHICL